MKKYIIKQYQLDEVKPLFWNSAEFDIWQDFYRALAHWRAILI